MLRTAAVLLVAASLAFAADKPAKAPARPLGTWTRAADGVAISMEFKADTFVFKITHGDKAITAEGSYATTSDGLLFGAITRTEPGDGGPAKGDLFSFQFSTTKDELTVSDLKGTKVGDEARKRVEGAYVAKK